MQKEAFGKLLVILKEEEWIKSEGNWQRGYRFLRPAVSKWEEWKRTFGY